MNKRKKIGIFIDYAIRIPNFQESYSIFKKEILKDKYDLRAAVTEEEKESDTSKNNIVSFYWEKEFEKDSNCLLFYAKTEPDKIVDKDTNNSIRNLFYCEDHYNKFIEDYSYNIYSDAKVTSKKDIDIINIAQAELFDITLIDEVISPRKISNTFYFLAKNRLFPQSVLFIHPVQKLNTKSYYAIWNPKEKKNQVNEEGSNVFLDWFKELEQKSKE